MSSKIKVDTIENVAGSGNVSLGSGHNLVVPGDNASIAIGQSTFTGGNIRIDLHSTGSGVGSQLAFANDHNTDKFFVGIEGNTTGNGMIYQQKNADVNFYANNSLKMTLKNSGQLLLGTNTEGLADGDDLTVSGSGNVGITIRSTDSNQNNLYFSDATSGAGEYAGYVTYDHSIDTLRLGASGSDVIRFLNAISGSGYTANSGSQIASHPMVAIRATGLSRTDSYYDFPVDTNGGCYVIAGYSHDQSTSTYARFENFQVGHNATYIGIYTLNANGGNGDITVTKPSNNTLRVTFNKNESSGSGSYATVEFVAVFGSNPF